MKFELGIDLLYIYSLFLLTLTKAEKFHENLKKS